eukprot:6194660-Pleurochrysis_carterae.AAC.2
MELRSEALLGSLSKLLHHAVAALNSRHGTSSQAHTAHPYSGRGYSATNNSGWGDLDTEPA